MTFADAPADTSADTSADTQASDTARPAGAARESSASASPVSGSIRSAEAARLATTSSSARTLGLVLAGVLTVLAVMVGAAAWQNWRTDD